MTDRSETKRRLQSGRQTTADQKRKECDSRDNRSNQVTFAMDTVRVSTLDTSRDTSDVLLADPERMKVALSINGHPVQLEYDTGAAVTVVSKTTWARMGKPSLRRSLVRCHDFNGNDIMVKGQTFIQVRYNDQSIALPLLVAAKGDDVMGRPWIRALQLCHCSLKDSSSMTSYVFSVSPSPQARGAGDELSVETPLQDFSLFFDSGPDHGTKVRARRKLKGEDDGNDAVAETIDGNDTIAESTDGNDAVAESTDDLLHEVNDDLPQDAFASPAESTVKGEDDGNDAVAESTDDKAADDLFYEVNDDLLQAAFASSAELTVPDTSQEQQLLPCTSTRERRLPRDRPPLRYES
uniref:Peptidase A2 domain-containing protein n=1 Tax=Plectus sambesii TaxID=2011161 RepID=A0A914VV89_9BILA